MPPMTPMRLLRIPEPFDHSDFVFEPKLSAPSRSCAATADAAGSGIWKFLLASISPGGASARLARRCSVAIILFCERLAEPQAARSPRYACELANHTVSHGNVKGRCLEMERTEVRDVTGPLPR
jgi:hypothetical protein